MEQRVAIFELQDALAQILAARGFPWVVSPDGIFGPETTEAVRMFQQMGEAAFRHSDALLNLLAQSIR